MDSHTSTSLSQAIKPTLTVRRTDGTERYFYHNGVRDLFFLYHKEPELLAGSMVEDKVVGKGAAVLLCAGRVKSVATPLISQSALDLLHREGISVTYTTCVPYIINRAGTDKCPVERLCEGIDSVDCCIEKIAYFLLHAPSGKPHGGIRSQTEQRYIKI